MTTLREKAAEEFNANELIAGFPLPSIQRAMVHIGIMDDRDDVKTVAGTLKCPENQAVRVLEELERRGLVTKTKKRKQWDKTEHGHRLAYYWQAPRKLVPAIERGDASEVTNMGFESVPCSIHRATPDEEVALEEAMLDVGTFKEYDNERLVEINVLQPNDYAEPDSGGHIELSVYLSVEHARQFMRGLEQAIAEAERELARRAAREKRRERNGRAKAAGAKQR